MWLMTGGAYKFHIHATLHQLEAYLHICCKMFMHGAMAAVQVMASQLIPSRDSIFSTMTSQGQQNSFQKSRPLHWPMKTVFMDSPRVFLFSTY